MDGLTLNLFDISGTGRIIPESLRIDITSLGRSVEGGDKEARVKVIGGELDLWALVDTLGNPAKIYSLATPCWEGYVHAVRIRAANGFQLTASLDSLYNRVKVTYSQVDAETSDVGEQAETSWYSNTDSTDAYGNKEKILRVSEATIEQAQAAAQRALVDYAWPLSERDFGSLGQRSTPEAELILRGWFDTLDWVYYAQTAGKESYEDIATGLQAFGNAAATTKVAQSIQLAATTVWAADMVKVRVKKEGAPVDNLTVELCADSAGVPGTVLASAILAGASVPENLNWVTLTLSARVALALSTTYWIVVRRSGANDGTNYYEIDANEALGYSRGNFKIWNGSAWVARSPDADMLFALLGVVETTVQISQIVTACGQFLAGTFLDVNSGIYSSPYRDGSASGLSLARELLRAGTTNSRRLRANVRDDLQIWIDEEPAMGSEDYQIDSHGKLYDAYGAEVRPEFMPAGVWMQLKDIIPIQASLGMIADPTRVFVEEAIYTQGRMRWKFRGVGNVINLTGVY